MSTFRYRCMECKEEIEESSEMWGKPPKKFVAMCSSCAMRITKEFLEGNSVANCRDCETQRQQVPAERMCGSTPVCDSHFRSRMGMPAALSTRRPTCYPCQEQGKRGVPATVKLNRMFMCREHSNAASVAEGPPQAITPEDVEVKETKKEKKKMARKVDVDWQKVQQERNDGATVTALAEKYGCSTPTICGHTKAAAGGGTRAIAKHGGRLSQIADRAARSTRKSNAAAGAGGSLDGTIADLKERRDKLVEEGEKLTQAIETLEEINA